MGCVQLVICVMCGSFGKVGVVFAMTPPTFEAKEAFLAPAVSVEGR